MGEMNKESIQEFKMKKLEKKYKDIFNSKDFIDKTSDLDKELKEMHESLKKFDRELEGYKEKDQKKIRDFRDNDDKQNVV